MSKVSVIVVLDESGSMAPVAQKTIDGYNDYTRSLAEGEGDITVTLFKFNSSRITKVYANTPVKTVTPLVVVRAPSAPEGIQLKNNVYYPSGGTPLYDAIAQSIHEHEKLIDSNTAVLCVIITDGEENASREFDRDAIFKMIHEREQRGWTFTYLGADQDAWGIGMTIGLQMGNTLSYRSTSPDIMFSGLKDSTKRYANAMYFSAEPTAVLDFFSNSDNVNNSTGKVNNVTATSTTGSIGPTAGTKKQARKRTIK